MLPNVYYSYTLYLAARKKATSSENKGSEIRPK